MKELIATEFGEKALDFALSYNHQESLRLELSGVDNNIEMFLQAYNRTKNIEVISICLAFSGFGSLLANLSIFCCLKECNTNIPQKHFVKKSI